MPSSNFLVKLVIICNHALVITNKNVKDIIEIVRVPSYGPFRCLFLEFDRHFPE
jgi:hypothetical protein